MAKKPTKQPVKKEIKQETHSTKAKQKPSIKWDEFKKKYTPATLVILIAIFSLFIVSIFKNICYPLFWADESMTVVGSQRVLEFGYPKVHDGKNVFYDLRHTNPKLGINEKDDAYVGGTGWGHYYFATIGVKIAEGFNDIYIKTGIIRSTFAFAGILGLLLFAYLSSIFFLSKFEKFLFAGLFFLFELFSVSLALLLREARYYSLAILLISLITGLYAAHRFYKPFNKFVFAAIISLSLWLTYVTFSPAYFILIATIGLSEAIIILYHIYRKEIVKEVFIKSLPTTLSLLISFLAIFPLLSYFKTFEISKALEAFNGYGSKMYWENVSTVFNYFKNFEVLWLGLVLKVLLLFSTSKLIQLGNIKFKASLFFTLLFIVYWFAISKVPNFVYTRYIIPIQPVLAVIVLLDIFTLNDVFSLKEKPGYQPKTILLIVFSAFFTFYMCVKNSKPLSGHITELSQQYKGPLDFTIPYILEKYKNTASLIIATNYEETSYMYYLKSKVIVGFIGNNLEEDSKLRPSIIAYRRPWGNYVDVFQNYMVKTPYQMQSFPIYDNPVNNIPELNFMPAFNHQFKTREPASEQEKTELFYRQ